MILRDLVVKIILFLCQGVCVTLADAVHHGEVQRLELLIERLQVGDHMVGEVKGRGFVRCGLEDFHATVQSCDGAFRSAPTLLYVG